MKSFELQFPPHQIPVLAARYPAQDDIAGLDAGKRRKTGGRGISRLARNADTEIEEALRLAVGAKTERAAIAVLCGLVGVHVPVASTVMTAVAPERYTIIDFRALEALGITDYNATVDFYLLYLNACRTLADRHVVSLRMLDRALWQWSKERPRGR